MSVDLDHKPLLTHEIGSLDKPGWRVKAYAGQPLSDRDLEEARAWGERLKVPDYERLIDLLRHAPFSKEQKSDLQRWSSLYALKLEEGAGLDVVYDGEQQRTEMYDWAVSHSDGFERRGSVRAFDNKYYTKAAVVAPISLRTPFHNAEFSYLVSVADAELKIPVTGAYTIADWSFDERYDVANHASRELGTTDQARPGYHVIKKFADLPYKPALGLGVLDIHSDFIESPELVRDRVLYAVNVFGDPARIHVTPDCGLRTRSWEVAFKKLRNMTAGVALARQELGLKDPAR